MSITEMATILKSYVKHIDMPISFLLLAVGIFLTIITGFPQIRNFRKFINFLMLKHDKNTTEKNTVSPLHALFTAMSTSLGMGCIAIPPLAVAVGGPGALFWLMVYSFFGCVTKFVEVVFALHFRTVSDDGYVFAGPSGYLMQVHKFWAYLYSGLTLFLFAGWSSLQAKTLSAIYMNYLSIPEYTTGIVMTIITYYLLSGGAKKIGSVSSNLVPIMCILYFGASFLILLRYAPLILPSIKLIFTQAFQPTAAIAGFAGSTALLGLREGIFKGAFITESGIGTAAIPHSLAATKTATNQGVLALYSVAADTIFCIVSGLIALVTGVWKSGIYSNALIFHSFKIGLPEIGPFILVFIITLFILGTTLGNSFNGSQSFLFITNGRWLRIYHAMVIIMIFTGTITETTTLWMIMEMVLPLVAISNVFCLCYLAIKHRKVLQT